MSHYSLAVLLAVLALPGVAATQTRPKPPVTAPPTARAADEPAAAPQETTATFADWTLRCAHPAEGAPTCEIVQGVSRDDRPVAQIAIGRPGKGRALELTILVPPSVSFASGVALAAAHDGDAPLLDLTWQRCVPGGCMANGAVSDELRRRLHDMAEPGRIVFTDASGRRIALPLSPKGLPQAMDALAKTEAD